jgi:puromycin-sensitive aminopeptidase
VATRKRNTKSHASKRAARPRRSDRLKTDLTPKQIELSFELDPSQPTFRGRAVYDLESSRRRRSLELHSLGLRISAVRAIYGDRVLRGQVEEHVDCETLTLRFEGLLPSGPFRLELGFRGRVRRDLRGLYGDGEGDGAWLASQLCPTDARRFFPCFDEPGIKARYQIQVLAPRNQTVLSNAPIESEEILEDGRQRVQFETTAPLSSYLVAVAVGPFEASPVRHCGSTAIRVWTLPGSTHLTRFGLDAAVESLSRLETWFDMPHPYPKLDLVALPAFAFGAMENAGAVFFRDSILLLDAEEASLEDRKRTAEVVAHELSHMWFGNSVTMKWWNDLWLNEAFATWMAYEIIESWRPQWQIWLDFAHRREEALTADALASSHPIAPPIRSAEEAQENFDAITYTKGASVLRMLHRYLGADVFREGIRLYMRRHTEGNAEASDLWKALSEASGEPVERIVAPWTLQTGYPLVSVDAQPKSAVSFSQARFLALPSRSVDPTRWTIPLVLRTGRHSKKKATTPRTRTMKRLFSKRRDVLTESESRFDWIYANDAEAGFFRVDHGESGRRALLENLSVLSASERIGHLGTRFALARLGRIPITSLLDLLEALGEENNAEVLGSIESILAHLDRRLLAQGSSEADHHFRGWICRIFSEGLGAVAFPQELDEDEYERLRVGRLASIVGGIGRREDIVREAERRAAQHIAEGTPLAGEIAEPILRIAAAGGGAMLHAALRNKTRTAPTPQARRLYLFALAEFASEELIDTSFDAALDPDLAPAPDRAQLIAALLASPRAALPTWKRLQENWKRLEKEMPPIALARLAGATASALPPSSAKEVSAFFARHPLAAGDRVLRQVREELRISARFERLARADFERFLGEDSARDATRSS